MAPIDTWRAWTTPTTEGELARRREAILLATLAGMVAMSLITQLIQLASFVVDPGVDRLLWWAINIAVGTGFYGLLRLARAGHRRAATHALLAILGALAVSQLLTIGISDPMVILLVAVIVVLAALLLGLRPSLIALGISAAVLVPIVALQHAGTLKPLATPTGTDIGGTVGLLVVLAALLLLLWLYTRDMLTSIDDTLTGASPNSPLRQLRTKALTLREVEVVQLIADGHSNNDIASRLFVSGRTIQSHVSNAMKKTNCTNRTELGVLAIREGLVPLEQPGSTDEPDTTTTISAS